MRILLKASWIITKEIEPVKNGFVVIEKGKVKEIRTRKPEGQFKEYVKLKGVLLPPLVNAHTHLELSKFNFSPELCNDFFSWLLSIIGKRSLLSLEELKEAVKEGIRESRKSGTYYIGDISSFGVSPKVKVKGIKAFREFIGKDFNPQKWEVPLSAHAVYSVSFKALKEIARVSRERGEVFQIHLGESEQEERFVKCLPNRFEGEIYKLLKRKRYERVCADNLTDYLKKAGALNENLIAVHCTNLSPKELEELKRANSGIVLCPKSNCHLKVGFPKVEELIGYDKVALGTDGLSTNNSLSVLSELRTLYYKLEGKVRVKELLPMITVNGGRVLGIENYGEKAVFTFIKEEKKEFQDPFSPLLSEETNTEILDFSSPL
ncbi:amidohydrolase family protein [Thermovibrio sp.]